jgi:hypothetical protein
VCLSLSLSVCVCVCVCVFAFSFLSLSIYLSFSVCSDGSTLASPTLSQVPLYKYVFPPDLPHPTLAVIGLVQPLGSLMPISEMQCRWVSRVLTGKARTASRCRGMHGPRG